MINIGGGLNSVKDIYIGNKKVMKAYVGNELVYESIYKKYYIVKNGVFQNNCQIVGSNMNTPHTKSNLPHTSTVNPVWGYSGYMLQDTVSQENGYVYYRTYNGTQAMYPGYNPIFKHDKLNRIIESIPSGSAKLKIYWRMEVRDTTSQSSSYSNIAVTCWVGDYVHYLGMGINTWNNVDHSWETTNLNLAKSNCCLFYIQGRHTGSGGVPVNYSAFIEVKIYDLYFELIKI